jgi:CheY-like chemotaxis protein
MEALGRVAGGVAHDFNNLMTVITTCAELTRFSLVKDDPRYDHMEQILGAAERGKHLLEKLGAFARGRPTIQTTVDVGAAVSSILAALRTSLPRNVTAELTLRENLWPVHFNAIELDQIILNLVVNARDAMPNGGKLSVLVENSRRPGKPEAQDGEGWIHIRVSDTGTGIDPAVGDKIFEPFFTTKPVGEGTGLGLAVCHGIVQSAGGHITFASQVGKGTSFDIYLPRAAELRGAGDDITSGDSDTIATVLVVDDDGPIRTAITRALGSNGYKVLAAKDGVEALAILSGHHACDLVLSDVRMPRMDGMELATHVRHTRPGLPILLMSGYAPDIQPESLDQLGIAGILAKPFTPDALYERLEKELQWAGRQLGPGL